MFISLYKSSSTQRFIHDLSVSVLHTDMNPSFRYEISQTSHDAYDSGANGVIAEVVDSGQQSQEPVIPGYFSISLGSWL